ncbi:hypothetical protein M9H77_11109 [Catharanthus roseus]|uniref:Uncharacterized protein n=1 Tax=Catharanthus roseus TaxID=4058 RepID=A0ACC0BDJ7_CATRO|nr:hypothetical protein M9H77_11109 [Catharanthus roseus]
MATATERAIQWLSTPKDDSENEMVSFDESKIGVKGLVDSGVQNIPKIFVREGAQIEKQSKSSNNNNNNNNNQVPVIDIGVDGASQDPIGRSEIVKKLKDACETWGFFQIVNHGIPLSLLDKATDSTIKFHEQDPEIKKQYYSRDTTRRVIFNSNFFLYNTSKATWKDTFLCQIAPVDPNWEPLPQLFRGVMDEYGKEIERVGLILYELLSEALGLDKNYLRDMGCAEGLYFKGHYAPACPQPELTIGTVTHTDFGFLTICLQNEIGGLEVLYENEYIEVPPTRGALSVNLGDMFCICTNNKFKSVPHRALAKDVGPRINLAGFLRSNYGKGYTSRRYKPIKELLSEDNPPIYGEVTLDEYIKHYTIRGFDGVASLPHFMLQNAKN